MQIHSFAPVVSKEPKILVLGSMPGEESLRQQEYYAHGRNSFWKLMHELLATRYLENYSDRLFMLEEHDIALWDVLQHCERQGSLDQNIKNEYPNNFETFFTDHSNIKAVFFNGQKAAKSFEKHIGLNRVGVDFHVLPSTSPAHAIAYETKLKAWSKLTYYLRESP